LFSASTMSASTSSFAPVILEVPILAMFS